MDLTIAAAIAMWDMRERQLDRRDRRTRVNAKAAMRRDEKVVRTETFRGIVGDDGIDRYTRTRRWSLGF
jgi:hypothetical protein